MVLEVANQREESRGLVTRTGASRSAQKKPPPPFFLSLLKLLLCAGFVPDILHVKYFWCLGDNPKIYTIVVPNLQMKKLSNRAAFKKPPRRPPSESK